MRPEDKGESPYKEIKEYQEALPYLEKKIGLYCSYCEMPINHVPEVEHMISKKHGGDKTAWSNLLLGCKYCNSRKSAKTTPQNAEDYLWPDAANTAIAFSYTNGIPKVNAEVLNELDPTGSLCEKAQNTYDMVELGNEPDLQPGGKKQDKDRRFLNRNLSYNKALISLKNWNHVKDASECYQNAMKEQIIMTATADGFFSVWMMVFADEPEICLALLERYPGTNKVYYDEQGKIKKIFLKKEKTNK